MARGLVQDLRRGLRVGGCGTGDRAGCGVEVELAAVVWAVELAVARAVA